MQSNKLEYGGVEGMYTARNIMTTNVIAIPATATVDEAARTLIKQKMSGAPVVDENGQLIGIISEYQLLELIYDPQLTSKPIRDLMTTDVITVDAGDSLDQVTNLLVLHRIRRVPVVQNGRPVGIITRGDLLRWRIEGNAPEACQQAEASV